jgi:ribosomal protein S18 acetylase RimI-like enzyme
LEGAKIHKYLLVLLKPLSFSAKYNTCMNRSFIEVRKALPGDAPVIAGFQISMAMETEQILLDVNVVSLGVQAVFHDVSKGQYFVALEDGKIIGSMLTTPEWSDWRNRIVLWIQSVYILPEYRRKGVFRKLYEFVKRDAEKDPTIGGLRLYVDKTNVMAQKVYRQLGMNGEHYQVFEWMKDF